MGGDGLRTDFRQDQENEGQHEGRDGEPHLSELAQGDERGHRPRKEVHHVVAEENDAQEPIRAF